MPPPKAAAAHDGDGDADDDARRRGGRGRRRAAREDAEERRAGGERPKGDRHAGSGERGRRANSRGDGERPKKEDGGKKRKRERRGRSAERLPAETKGIQLEAPPAASLAEKDVPSKSQHSAKKGAGCLTRWLRFLAFILFAAGYAALVIYMLRALSEAKESEVVADTDGECATYDCGAGMVCVVIDDNGRGRCTVSGRQNVQVLEVVVGIMMAFPAAVLVPWSLHALWRLSQAYMQGDGRRRRQQGPAKTVDIGSTFAGKVPKPPSMVGRLGALWSGSRHKQGADEPLGLEGDIEGAAGSILHAADPVLSTEPTQPSKFAQAKGAAAATPVAADADDDEDLDDLFAPVKSWTKEGYDMGGKPGGPTLFKGDDGDPMCESDLDQPLRTAADGADDEDADMDDWFAKPRYAPGASQSRLGGSRGGPEGSFVAPRQGPAAGGKRAAAPPPGAGVGELSEVGQSDMGLSCLFATTKTAATGANASRAASGESRAAVPPPSNSGSESGSEEEEEDDDDDAGPAVTVDFFAFAMRVSRYGEAVSADSGDVPAASRSSPLYAASEASVDSLSESAEATLAELFHAPLPPALA